MSVSDRSFAEITDKDLKHLSDIAAADRAGGMFLEPKWRFLKNRLLCVALCQGAALHYLDKVNGVKDFDIWTFYESVFGEHRFPEQRRAPKKLRDFGSSKFGRRPNDGYQGRRVDMFGRSIKGASAYDAVRLWLSEGLRKVDKMSPKRRDRLKKEGKLPSSYCLALKAVVAIYPPSLRGKVIWGQKDRPANPPIKCK